MKYNFLKPLTTVPKNKYLWGFDIETYGEKNKFLMCSIIGDCGIKKTFWDKEEALKFMMRKKTRDVFNKGYITATNLQFDILGLLDGSSQFDNFYPIIRNSRFLLVKIPINKQRNLKFIDTGSFVPFSVKKLGEIVNLPKLPQPRCFKRKPKDYWEEKELEEYNMRDSEITYKAIKLLQRGYNNLGGEMKITASSSAMDLYRRKNQKEIYWQPKRNLLEYLYNGYYGGRVEVIKRGFVKNLNYYDFNSLYPSVMKNGYPFPNSYKYSRYIKLDTIRKYEGICKVKITSPEQHIPYLPFRILKPMPKLIFPTGTFTGYYTFFELRKALEHGYTIDKFYNGLIYFKLFYPFKDYVNRLYAIRKRQKKENDPMELITKLNMNSLYGKFAQKIDEKDEIIHESNVTFKMIQDAQYVDRNGSFFTFKRPYTHIPAFVNPIFSIYTTAYARDKLYNHILKCKDRIYYYDTDSLMTDKCFDTSDKLGELKLEFKIKDAVLVKPKMYRANDYVKCKGLGFMNVDNFNEVLSTRKRGMSKFVKFKEANRRGLIYNEILDFDKVIDLEDNKRRWTEKFNCFSCQDSTALKI